MGRLTSPQPRGPNYRHTALCQGKCGGSDRPVFDSPAVWANMPDKSRGLVCKCCVMPLRLLTGLEDLGAAAPNVLPNVDQTGRKRWWCDQCGYNVTTLPELKAKENASAQ